MHDNLSVGDVIELGDVGGDFVLPANLPSKLLLIAGRQWRYPYL
jgi:ferredoxin-NADP reductase